MNLKLAKNITQTVASTWLSASITFAGVHFMESPKFSQQQKVDYCESSLTNPSTQEGHISKTSAIENNLKLCRAFYKSQFGESSEQYVNLFGENGFKTVSDVQERSNPFLLADASLRPAVIENCNANGDPIYNQELSSNENLNALYNFSDEVLLRSVAINGDPYDKMFVADDPMYDFLGRISKKVKVYDNDENVVGTKMQDGAGLSVEVVYKGGDTQAFFEELKKGRTPRDIVDGCMKTRGMDGVFKNPDCQLRYVTNSHTFYKDGKKIYENLSEDYEVGFGADSKNLHSRSKFLSSKCGSTKPMAHGFYDECEVTLEQDVIASLDISPVLRIFPNANDLNLMHEAKVELTLITTHPLIRNNKYKSLRLGQGSKIVSYDCDGSESCTIQTRHDTETGSSGGALLAFFSGNPVKVGTHLGNDITGSKETTELVSTNPSKLVISDKEELVTR